MKKNCKNCKCKKKVVIPPTPCFTSAGCPPKPACEDTFDIDCINYTGEPIICNGEVLVESGESLPTVLTTLVDKICNKSCEINVEFEFQTGGIFTGSSLLFNITGGIEPYVINASVVQGPFTGITISDCVTYDQVNYPLCFTPVVSGTFGFYVIVYCLPNKFYIGSDNNKKYAGTIRIEVIDTFGCSHDFFYNVVIDQEDCQFEPE